MGRKIKAEDGPCIWVDKAAHVEIVDGIVEWTMQSGSETICMRARPSVLVESIKRGTKAVADWQAQESAIKRFPGKDSGAEH